MTVILAIDPGISGALAFYYPDEPGRTSVYDMPLVDGDVNPHEIMRLIRLYAPAWAIIEQVSAMPKEGVSSVWRFASAYTAARITVMLANIPLVLVRPNAWKKAMNLPGGKDGKEASRTKAIHAFPECAVHFARKKDHNRAEAALLALYAATSKKAFQYELLPH